ncbi:MAG: serpin family protein [Methanolinea sp.]
MNPHSLTGTDSRHSLDSPAIGKLNTKDNALKSEGVLSRAPIPAQKSAIVSHPQHAMPNHTVPVISAPAMTSKLNSSKYSFQKITSPRSFFEARFNLKKNQTGKTPAAIPVSENAKAVVQANNQFGIDFFSRLASDPAQEGKNIFFSPWSISSALAITYEGARNTTADEIRSVFHFPSSYDTLRQGYMELSNGLNSGNSGVTLNTANALWAEKTYQFLPEYITTADQYYGAKTTNLDFVTKPEESRQIINQWVEEKTKDKIKDLIPEGGIDSSTVLAITNAIYFKGTWVKQFDTAKTIEDTFVLDDGMTIKVPMMVRTDEDAEYWYTENDDIQVLGMPYSHKKGNGLSMLVLLPKENDLEAVEASLSVQRLAALNQALTYQRVKVTFPKFKMETTYNLADMLSEMGMSTAFNGADLSGMDGTRSLFIDEVYHKAFVDVNEEGTEAAAATAVVVNRAMAPGEQIPVFRADHPFLFLIQDNDTGNILFMGRMMNPAGA